MVKNGQGDVRNDRGEGKKHNILCYGTSWKANKLDSQQNKVVVHRATWYDGIRNLSYQREGKLGEHKGFNVSETI